MSSRRLRGFSLVEMIIAMVIISVGLVGVLMAFNTSVKSSADPLIRKQLLAVAEEMMEEILLKPYAPDATGSIAGCNRENADDLSDYNDYNQSICNIDGTADPSLAGYNVSVSVVENAAPTTDRLTGLPANTVKTITVTVTRGGESLSLVGWRTNYGGTP